MRRKNEKGQFLALCDKPKRVEILVNEKELLQIDAIAKKMGITRSDLIRKGIEIILQEVV